MRIWKEKQSSLIFFSSFDDAFLFIAENDERRTTFYSLPLSLRVNIHPTFHKQKKQHEKGSRFDKKIQDEEMAAALQIEKPEQPQLAKHDSTILGRIESNESSY